jgi:hypothetical protein
VADETVLDLGAIATHIKKVKLGDEVYDLPELTVLQTTELFGIADRAQKADTPETLQKAVLEFGEFMRGILPEVDREVWFKLSPEQIGALIAYLSPFRTGRAARRQAERQARRNGQNRAAR